MATTRQRNGQANGQTNGRATKERPVFTRKYFPVEVAVFEHEHGGNIGYSVNLTRVFRRDDNSPWETTPYLNATDLLPASLLLQDAYRFIKDRLQDAYEANRDDARRSEAEPHF